MATKPTFKEIVNILEDNPTRVEKVYEDNGRQLHLNRSCPYTAVSTDTVVCGTWCAKFRVSNRVETRIEFYCCFIEQPFLLCEIRADED